MNWTGLIQDYLLQRRQLGYKLTIEGRQLLNFARYAERQNADLPLTVSLARDWATMAPSGSAISMARRASMLRPLSRYLSTISSAQGLLPTRLMGPTHRRLPPFIYSAEDVAGLMGACDSLFSISGLRRHTMRTLIGLLVSTGLRPGEAVRLRQHDVDLNLGELTINCSKGWKRRFVPLHLSTIAALKTYCQYRNQLAPSSTSDSFFINDRGQALDIRAAGYAFNLLRSFQGFSCQNNGRRPRLYDLRHTFVCHRLLAWYPYVSG